MSYQYDFLASRVLHLHKDIERMESMSKEAVAKEWNLDIEDVDMFIEDLAEELALGEERLEAEYDEIDEYQWSKNNAMERAQELKDEK